MPQESGGGASLVELSNWAKCRVGRAQRKDGRGRAGPASQLSNPRTQARAEDAYSKEESEIRRFRKAQVKASSPHSGTLAGRKKKACDVVEAGD